MSKNKAAKWIWVQPEKNIWFEQKIPVEMFSTAIKGGKAFTAEQKLKELKKKGYLDWSL